jgi:hypothetical protein
MTGARQARGSEMAMAVTLQAVILISLMIAVDGGGHAADARQPLAGLGILRSVAATGTASPGWSRA